MSFVSLLSLLDPVNHWEGAITCLLLDNQAPHQEKEELAMICPEHKVIKHISTYPLLPSAIKNLSSSNNSWSLHHLGSSEKTDPNYDPADHWASIQTDIALGK